MPANLGVDRGPIIGDPRFRIGSYIEDGEHLFRVLGRQMIPRRGLTGPHEILTCENCLNLYPVPLELIDCRRHWRLVRALPGPVPPAGYQAP